MQILRHDNNSIIGSDLNPIEDIMNLMSSLKSFGFTSDLLKEVHGFNDSSEIKKTTKLISYHINNAQGLAEQGLGGAPESSYLSLYYSTLNLMKVYLLILGKRTELEKNRWHGAKYREKEMTKQFLNERVFIDSKGTIPLIYNTLTNQKISKSGVYLTLKEIYQNIQSISAEYSTITKKETALFLHQNNVVRDDKNGHYLKIKICDSRLSDNPPNPRKIKAYSGIRLINNDNNYHYESQKLNCEFENAKKKLTVSINRSLLSDITYQGPNSSHEWFSLTPISGRKHVFNEDLCIMLAYFHLSNVVRYNPEHLYKLMDSKYWIIMLALRKHGFLRFQKLMWGNFIGKSFDIN